MNPFKIKEKIHNSLNYPFNNYVFKKNWRGLKILSRIGWCYARLRLPSRWFPNKNSIDPKTGLAQPQYANIKSDIQPFRIANSTFWVQDLNSLYLGPDRKGLIGSYEAFDYDSIAKAYYPTKNSAMESVNQARIWDHSYFNPKNQGKIGPKYVQMWRQADALFADMMTNTQGIYKARVVKVGSLEFEKSKKYFTKILNENRDEFGAEYQQCEDVLEELVRKKNLYFMDYEAMRWVEDEIDAKGQSHAPKYEVDLKSINGQTYRGYMQIPFSIYAEIPGYLKPSEEECEVKKNDPGNRIICIGAVFNEDDTVYHPFDKGTDIEVREKWEIAKTHMASTDNNDFIIREHLGTLHYASAIYTTAFCNAAKVRKEWSWLRDEFIACFSEAYLQINFIANLTLVDTDEPVAEKTIHLRAGQSLKIMQRENRKFNVTNFNPHKMGSKDTCYQSDAVVLSKKYYDRLAVFVDYLFTLHKDSLKGNKSEELGKILYKELGNGQFDGIPEDIFHPQKAYQTLKEVMINLIYLWVVHHGETFSIISVGNAYFFCPTFMRKPLNDLKKSKFPLTNKDKQEWLAPFDVWCDSMALSKQVTYRSDLETIVSKWNTQKVDRKMWYETLQYLQKHPCENRDPVELSDFEDHWNKISLEAYEINYNRTVNKNLFNLHWLMPQEMPNALNI